MLYESCSAILAKPMRVGPDGPDGLRRSYVVARWLPASRLTCPSTRCALLQKWDRFGNLLVDMGVMALLLASAAFYAW
jgi:hypothetical protein